MMDHLHLPALVFTLAVGCSAGGGDGGLVVGGQGTGGAHPSGPGGSGGSGLPPILTADAGATKVFSAHIESPPGIAVEFITLSCESECADVLAVAEGGREPYAFVWEDGSTNPMRRVCPTATARYAVSVTDSGVRSGELRRPPQTVEAALTANRIACDPPSVDSGAPPVPPPCAPPIRVIQALPAQSTPYTGAGLADYTSSVGGAIHAIARGTVVPSPGCTQLLIAGDAAGTAPAGWDDHLLVEYRDLPGGPVTKRWNYGGYTLSYRGQPVAQGLAPTVPGWNLVPPVLNPLPYGYPPLAIDLMTEVPSGATTFELTLLVLDESNVGSTTDVWVIRR